MAADWGKKLIYWIPYGGIAFAMKTFCMNACNQKPWIRSHSECTELYEIGVTTDGSKIELNI